MLADCIPKMLVSICNGGGTGAGWCLPPITAENFGSARLHFGTQYISLTILDIQYVARMFHIVQQQLRDYTMLRQWLQT